MEEKMSKIKQSEHVFICGRTGSGKTFLAETYLAGFPNVVVLDTKGFVDWNLAGFPPVYDSLSELVKNVKDGKAIYRPNPFEMDMEFYDKFFEWVYERQNTIVYIDELMSIATSSQIPFFLKAILTRGRQRNTACWSLTQRPSGIPIICMSEATHFFVFDLNIKEDRDRLKKITGNEIMDYKPSELCKINGKNMEYPFFYYNYKMDKPNLSEMTRRR
jgi:hypothetical protein